MRRALLLLPLVLLGCTEEEEAPPVGPRIALTRDFEDFLEWRAYELDTMSITEGHRSGGTRMLYIDREPPAAGEPFPLGTILVKARQEGPMSQWTVHAMVKRGNGYNPDGAVDWEFFDLHLTDEGGVSIRWRGTGDDGAAYIDPTTGERLPCNQCHVYGAEHDYVFSRRHFGDDAGN